MKRDEHIKWCKERALEYLDKGDINQAYTSMASDLSKHSDTENHHAIEIGMGLMIIGRLSTVEDMRKFIEGFH